LQASVANAEAAAKAGAKARAKAKPQAVPMLSNVISAKALDRSLLVSANLGIKPFIQTVRHTIPLITGALPWFYDWLFLQVQNRLNPKSSM
jgi:hypothetical protein